MPGAHANPPPSSPASYHCSAYTCPINFELRPNAATISCVDPDCDELCEWSCTYTGPNVCCVAATTTIAPSTNAPSTIAPSTNAPTTPSAPPPSAQPTPCVSCDLVPCGYCQEGCPPTACKYDPELDEIRGGANRRLFGSRQDHTQRNGCASVDGVMNSGLTPAFCRPSGSGAGSCASCDLVPCGYCQEGCAFSTCTYEGDADKPGALSRNGCASVDGILNARQLPPQCRPAPCASCGLVPCGFCQDGCPPSTCTYETGVDQVGATERNACASGNAGQLPTQCRSAPCASCDSVPCGHCQEGCPSSACTYETEVDKPGATSRNECATVDGTPNSGETPFKCRPAACASCDSVPCGFCQEGCQPSSCTYEGGVDKVGATSRNECAAAETPSGLVPNFGELPIKCRAGTTPTATVTVALAVHWEQVMSYGPISASDKNTLISVYKTEVEALYSSLSLTFTTPIIQEMGSGTYNIGGDERVSSEIQASAETNNPNAFSAIATTMLKANLQAALDTALPGKVHNVLSDWSQIVLKSASVDEDESAGRMSTGAIIGVVLGAVAVAGVVGAVAYREWSRRKIPIDDVNSGDTSKPCSNVETRVDVCLSNVDACLSAADDREPSKHSLTATPSEENEFSRTHSRPTEFFEDQATRAINA